MWQGPPKSPERHRRDFLIVLGLFAIVAGCLVFAINFPTAALIGGGVVAAAWLLFGLWLATM